MRKEKEWDEKWDMNAHLGATAGPSCSMLSWDHCLRHSGPLPAPHSDTSWLTPSFTLVHQSGKIYTMKITSCCFFHYYNNWCYSIKYYQFSHQCSSKFNSVVGFHYIVLFFSCLILFFFFCGLAFTWPLKTCLSISMFLCFPVYIT